MSTAPSLLLQSSTERSGGEVPENGKINTGAGDCSSEAPSLFSGSHHRSPNIISNEAGIAQTRSLRKADEVGHRAKRVQHQIQAENCNKGAGPSRLCHGICSNRTCRNHSSKGRPPNLETLCTWSLKCIGKRSRPNSDLTIRDRH